jgi:hypothetical protein
MADDTTCALCDGRIVEPGSGVLLHVHDSERRWPMRVHDACLKALLAADIPPLPAGRGRIPGDTACGVCGRRLPVIGRHPTR